MNLEKLLSIFLLAFSPGVRAQDNVGYFFVGLTSKSWPCEPTLKILNRHDVSRFGFLFSSFGHSYGCLNRILRTKDPKAISIYVENGACLRNHRCQSYETFRGESLQSATRKLRKPKSSLTKSVIRDFQIASRLIPIQGDITCYCSPVLESDFPDDVRRILLNYCETYLPHCAAVDNPEKKRCLKDTICERHSPDVKVEAPCIANQDGNYQLSPRKFLWANPQCDMALTWKGKYNCLANGEAFKPPRSRDCRKAWSH